jgi:hypothetical protein
MRPLVAAVLTLGAGTCGQGWCAGSWGGRLQGVGVASVVYPYLDPFVGPYGSVLTDRAIRNGQLTGRSAASLSRGGQGAEEARVAWRCDDG